MYLIYLGTALTSDPWEVVKAFPKWVRLRIGKAFFLWSKYDCWCAETSSCSFVLVVHSLRLPFSLQRPLGLFLLHTVAMLRFSLQWWYVWLHGFPGHVAARSSSSCHSSQGPGSRPVGHGRAHSSLSPVPGDVLPLLTSTYMYSCTYRKLNISKQLCPKLGFHSFSAGVKLRSLYTLISVSHSYTLAVEMLFLIT